MTTPNELSEYTKKTIREHEEWNKDWWLCLPDELFDFIEQEILEAERLTKDKCAKKAFDFADKLEKKMWVDASYARAVWNLIQSLK